MGLSLHCQSSLKMTNNYPWLGAQNTFIIALKGFFLYLFYPICHTARVDLLPGCLEQGLVLRIPHCERSVTVSPKCSSSWHSHIYCIHFLETIDGVWISAETTCSCLLLSRIEMHTTNCSHTGFSKIQPVWIEEDWTGYRIWLITRKEIATLLSTGWKPKWLDIQCAFQFGI